MVILDGDDWGTMVMDSEIDITGDTRMRGGYIRDDELNVNKMIAPSVEENQQQHTKECDKMTFENMEEVGTEAMNVMNVDFEGEERDDCVRGVRGWCKTQKLYGKKNTTSSTKWAKKKDGMFGCITRKKTSYTCIGKIECSRVKQESNGGVPSSKTQPVQHLGEGCKLSNNNTPVHVYSGTCMPGLPVGNRRKFSERII